RLPLGSATPPGGSPPRSGRGPRTPPDRGGRAEPSAPGTARGHGDRSTAGLGCPRGTIPAHPGPARPNRRRGYRTRGAAAADSGRDQKSPRVEVVAALRHFLPDSLKPDKKHPDG